MITDAHKKTAERIWNQSRKKQLEKAKELITPQCEKPQLPEPNTYTAAQKKHLNGKEGATGALDKFSSEPAAYFSTARTRIHTCPRAQPCPLSLRSLVHTRARRPLDSR